MANLRGYRTYIALGLLALVIIGKAAGIVPEDVAEALVPLLLALAVAALRAALGRPVEGEILTSETGHWPPALAPWPPPPPRSGGLPEIPAQVPMPLVRPPIPIPPPPDTDPQR